MLNEWRVERVERVESREILTIIMLTPTGGLDWDMGLGLSNCKAEITFC